MRFPNISYSARSKNDEFLFNPDVDEEAFRQYARENDPPVDWEDGGLDLMHPFCRDEWFKRGVLPERPYILIVPETSNS